MNFPEMFRIRQKFDAVEVENIEGAVATELGRLSLASIQSGQRVAITAGSRGVANIARILKAVIGYVKTYDAQLLSFQLWAAMGVRQPGVRSTCWGNWDLGKRIWVRPFYPLWKPSKLPGPGTVCRYMWTDSQSQPIISLWSIASNPTPSSRDLWKAVW